MGSRHPGVVCRSLPDEVTRRGSAPQASTPARGSPHHWRRPQSALYNRTATPRPRSGPIGPLRGLDTAPTRVKRPPPGSPICVPSSNGGPSGPSFIWWRRHPSGVSASSSGVIHLDAVPSSTDNPTRRHAQKQTKTIQCVGVRLLN